MKRLKVRRIYILSYIIILLVVITLAGSALIGYGMTSLRDVMELEQLKRAELAADDMEAQLDSFRQVRDRIKASYVVQPAYQKRAYTHRLELIDELRSYAQFPLIDAGMYLLSDEEDLIFFDRTCTDWETLCRIYWKIPADESLRRSLLDSGELALLRPEALGGDLIIALPFGMGSSENRVHMALFFRVRPEEIYARIQRVSGLSESEFSVALNGQMMLGDALYDWETVVSESGSFVVSLPGLSGSAYERLSLTQRTLLLLCGAMVVLGVILAVWMANRQYRPIGDIHRQLGGGAEGNELTYIEQTIAETLRENDRAKRDILAQMESLMSQSEIIEHQADKLRRQLVMLLLLGVYRGDQDVPVELTARFRHPKFAVLNVWCGDEPVQAEDIERCVSERWMLFAVQMSQRGRMAVLANLTNHDDLFELVTKLGRMLGNGVAIFSGEVVELSGVSVSFTQGFNGARPLESGYVNDFLLGSECRELFQAVRSGSRETALRCAAELSAALPKEQLPVIELRRIYLVLLKKLQNLAGELDGAIDEAHAVALMLSLSPDQFSVNLARCVSDLCEDESEEHLPESSEALRLLAYIDEHACEPEMSLSLCEEEFGFSRKKITAVLKRLTNMGFKEYVVYQRIERAKMLLLNTKLSISAISEMCGYESPSYFIKSFKAMTDKTPGQYQKDGE